MTALAMAAAAGGRRPVTLSGSLDATASGGTSISSTITVTVPGGNSGQIRINYVDVGTLLLHQVNLNGAGFTNFADGDVKTFTNGQTIALKTTGNGVGESCTFTLTDVDTNRTISPYGTAFHAGA